MNVIAKWLGNLDRFESSGSVCPTGAKIGSSYREFREIGGEIIDLERSKLYGNKLVRNIGRFWKPKVREIGIPLYSCRSTCCLDFLLEMVRS